MFISIDQEEQNIVEEIRPSDISGNFNIKCTFSF